MVETVSQIKNGITINVDGSVKNIIYVKRLHLEAWSCSYKNGTYLVNIMDDSIIHKTKKQKLFKQILMKKMKPIKPKIYTFYLHFY